MTGAICDASVVVKLLIQEEDSDKAQALSATTRMIAPDLIIAEIGNVIWGQVRFKTLDAQSAEIILDNFDRLPLDTRPIKPLLPRALSIATSLGHPIYDCFYLALAEHLNFPLVTADQRFISLIRLTSLTTAEVTALADFAQPA